ncbi:hypothetical protein I41_27000 [Lacipirellula limnantheis]|uniref:Uncharacterized protein n=1 Tax=Lacipirellula limnantheis TaxID=2528024 RepID=A0A517TYR3_9BACT|nr:hypothetical protein I41_27000 [Lacipirellula limnantheis]
MRCAGDERFCACCAIWLKHCESLNAIDLTVAGSDVHNLRHSWRLRSMIQRSAAMVGDWRLIAAAAQRGGIAFYAQHA